MKKFWLIIFLLIFLLLPKTIFAQGEFVTTTNITYDIADSGKTQVTYDINLRNTASDMYATSYTLTIDGLQPINPKAFENKTPLTLEQQAKDKIVSLKVNFINPVVGKDKVRNFQIVFDLDSIALKTGEIWEITVPKIADTNPTNSYQIKLAIPKVFGDVAYISPNAQNKTETIDKNIYSFTKDQVAASGVSAAFGKFQTFSFELTYHLENPLNQIAFVDVAIPPDTAFQKMHYASLAPKPSQVTIDQDGNWLARFYLKSKERVDVKALGNVQIYSSPFGPTIHPGIDYLETTKKESAFWQTTDPQIMALAQNLKTPRAIYNYVVSTLKYDYDRVKPNAIRLGAKGALTSPQNAICMEFTDLFVALARAAGIPAREINGFAYTENLQLQPLSLVADVLHSWPEYWDSTQNVWVPVDPTWGSTTGGEDFFDKLDLRHFTFVIHGSDPQKPYPPGSYKLGPNPQKDVFVAFSETPIKAYTTPTISFETQKLLFIPIATKIKVSNPGPEALYNKTLTISFDNRLFSTNSISILPPFATYEKQVKLPFSILGNNLPSQLRAQFDTFQEISPGPRSSLIIINIVIALVAIFVLIAVIFIKYARKKNNKAKRESQVNS